MTNAYIVVPARAAVDAGAGGVVIASLLQWLPPAAALVGLVYYLLLISENRRFLQMLNFITHFASFHIPLPNIVPTVVFRARLVADWKEAWRWSSMRLIALATALQTTLIIYPDVLRQYLPQGLLQKLVLVLFVLSAVGRITNFNPKGSDHVDGNQ